MVIRTCAMASLPHSVPTRQSNSCVEEFPESDCCTLAEQMNNFAAWFINDVKSVIQSCPGSHPWCCHGHLSGCGHSGSGNYRSSGIDGSQRRSEGKSIIRSKIWEKGDLDYNPVCVFGPVLQRFIPAA